MANLRGAGPFAVDSLSYDSAAVDFSASLNPLLDLDQRNILASPFISVNKMEANNNYENEELKSSAELGDIQNALDPEQGGGDEDDSDDDDEAWDSVSELASDEEYVTVDEEEEEGEEGEFEEEDDGEDEDGEDGDSLAEEEDDEEEEGEEENGEMEGENEMDDATISSGDEGGEKCAICLCAFHDQEVGMPESCDHTFCFECIYEWSKNVTTCPVDRSVFSLILVKNTIHGEIVRQMEVKAQEDVDEDQDPTYCEVCGECDREDRLLLCDECDAGYHCECLTPPLTDIPIEEWYCPNCATADHDDESSEEETMPALRRSLRRVREYARAIARTQVAERVLSRVRQARELRRINEEEHAGASSTATPAPRVPRPRRKTTRKRKTKRKTTKRKTTKRKTTKRKTTKRKKRKTTSTTTATGAKKKRRRKTTRRKRKVRRTSTGARTAQPSVAKTIRRRIAGKLNLVKPKVGSMMPDMKQKGEQSLLFKRHEIGVASLSLTGSEHLFDPSGYDDSPITRGPGAQSAPTPARPLSATPGPSSSGGPLDLLGSILQGQNILHMKSENITIHKDGTLSSVKKKDESSTPRKSPTKTAHRPSASSTASYRDNSDKPSSRTDSMKHVTLGQRSSYSQGQRKSESDGSRQESLRERVLQKMGCDDWDDDLEPVEMDVDDDDSDEGVETFKDDVKQKGSRGGSSGSASVYETHQRQGSNSHSKFTRTKVNAKGDGVRALNASLSTNDRPQGLECEARDENGNDESDGDVGYHGNNDNQGEDGDEGYQQGGDDDNGNQDENTVNNNNNNDGDGGGEGGDGEEGGEEGNGRDEEEEGGEEQQEEEDDDEGHEEEEELEDELQGEMEEEDGPGLQTVQEEQEEAYAEVGDMEERNDEAVMEREEVFGGHNEEDPAAEDALEEKGDGGENVADPDEEQEEEEVVEDSNQNDICEDAEEDVEEKEEDQFNEEQVDEEVGEVEEEIQDGEEQEEEEEQEEGEELEEEILELEQEQQNAVTEQHVEAENNREEEQDGGEEAEEEEKEDEDEDEDEDGEAEEGEEVDDEGNPPEAAENVNDNDQEERGGDEIRSKPVIGELECEDISDEDNVPEEEGDNIECESDEEGMIIETSDGHVIEAKPKSKDSRKERRSETSDHRETSTEVTESKHGASSAEEGEVKTDDESKKGKKARGKRKRKPKKRNRDKRNVVVDPRKSISLNPQIPPDLSRLPKRGEEPSGRREGSREAYGDLRQVIQVKRDTPYTAEELRRYHECWEEYNRRRDERRVERVGNPWDQYTYDQYAYYEAWRSMGGDFAAGRPWGLHVQRDRSPIYDRRKNGGEAQGFDPRLEAQRQSARRESERGKEEGSRKSSEKKTKSDSDSGRKDHATKKDSSRSQKDEKDKSKKEKTKSKGHVHENSARDKNGREREGGERDKKYRDKDKEKEKDKDSRDRHAHDREKDRSRHKEREKSRDRERSRKDRDQRSRDRDRRQSRDRERSRDRGRDRSRDRHYKKSRDAERSRSRDNDHSRSRHRSRSRDRERSRKRDRSSESDRVSSRDRRRDKSRDKLQDRGREKDSVRTSRDHDRDKERERTRESVKAKKIEDVKSTPSAKVTQRKERGKVTVDASGVRKILLGEKAKPKERKKVVEKPVPVPAVAKVDKVKVKKVKKDKTGGEAKVEKKGKKTKVKGEKKLTKGKKKKAAAKRPLSFDVEEIAAPAKKTKAPPAAEQVKKVEDIVLKPPSPLKFDDADDMIPVPSTTRSLSRSPDLYIDIAPDSDLSRTVAESPKVVPKVKSPTDVAVADSSHLETDMYDPFNPTASPPSGIKSPSPIPSEASPRHDNATSSSLEVFKRASTPPMEAPPNPTSTTDVSSSDMASNPPQPGMTNEDRLMLASQASQQITKILNQLATVPIAKPRISPESPVEQTMSSASIELGISPEHIHGSSLSVSSLGSEKDFKVDPIMPQENIGDVPEDDIEMSAVDLYNKNSRDRYLKKLYHQERVVEEVKLAIKPHYQRKVINKEDYKEILRKSVNQVCHSKTGEINPVKIRRLIDGYVKKVQHKNKKPSGGDTHKSGKPSGGSAGKSSFKSSSKSSSKSSKEPASASKLIEKGRSLGLKSK